jgi:hypothetical protein
MAATTVPSRLYQHAERVWREMHTQAVGADQLSGSDAYLAVMVPPGALGVYVGHLMHLFRGVGLGSSGQYHNVKGALVRMGTICQIRRGSALLQSAWVLLDEPTPELFAERMGPDARRRRRAAQLAPAVQATEVIAPDGLAAFLAKSPAGRTEALRAMTSGAAYLAVKALIEEVQTSANSQARTAAARTLLFLGRDVGGLEPDPLQAMAEQFGEELAQVHATPAPV